MNPKDKPKQSNDVSDLFCNPDLQSVPFPKLRIVPVREIPDDCVLVCVGPFCYLACYGVGEDPFEDCEIVCTETGNCYIVCPIINNS